MASIVHNIAVQVYKTFVNHPSKYSVDPASLTKLCDLTNRLTAEDVNFDSKLLSEFNRMISLLKIKVS